MKRFGQIIGVKPEAIEEYKRIHVKIWDEIAQAITEAGITNYSIFLKDNMLFAYFEYTGPDEAFEERMKKLASAPRMREWWDITESMQVPVPTRQPGEWWANMEEVFHQD
ncbi:MAG: L-rhamnose mutarotase [Anaerolineae bacterium]|jgi:L-rhamnose mutarotase|nr:L-rhamnose mutarotase [Anaerolineae bacterium]